MLTFNVTARRVIYCFLYVLWLRCGLTEELAGSRINDLTGKRCRIGLKVARWGRRDWPGGSDEGFILLPTR